ncbi:flagellar hook-associated protein FlgK [Ruegeria profundi]|uniref:Flagellar hook-associated protein 1 n=1 Tax=Ruegeria profundi TaxID=1685378 RepID=A0A0X3TT92_9RHOB|nr:flagellar hook-associated protein FlgK [Ruegeria profundi]KUJ77686.1 flagellar biosynthesis protein FlgK [Ruegeria profundi]
MNLSTAFNNAVSGLAASSRGTSVVSDNIANALTPGYARRSLELTTNRISGTGVRTVGVVRNHDPVLTANRRATDSDLAYRTAVSKFFTNVEDFIGTADDPRSLANALAEFDNSLITAASLPDSSERLDQVARTGRDLATSINRASEGVRHLRSEADRSIGRQVDSLNQTLKEIEKLNTKIPSIKHSGGDVGALLDQRQVLIDQVNAVVPVNVMARPNEQVSLYSDGGLILLEGSAAEFSFSKSGNIQAHMTLDNGLLSGLEMNGKPVRTSGDSAQIKGGALMAQFQIRDELAVEVQANLDSVARDLIERFETPGLDPTAKPTDPGLFTDDGTRFDSTAPAGLASRIGLNKIVDPDNGGDSRLLRDGLGATAPGNSGDATQLQAFGAILSESRPVAGAPFGTGEMRAADLTEALMSKAGSDAHTASQSLTFANSAQQEMVRIETAQGVNTDQELQNLIKIEQAYAANARVISVVDELMETLLRL